MKIRLYSLLLVMSVVFACQGQVDSKHLLKVPVFESQLNEQKGVLLDVRTATEFGEGHIDGAKNIDFLKEDFEINTAKLDKDAPVYVYCKSGGRSAKAVEKLRKQGFTKLYELDGGYNAWKEVKSSKKLK